MVQSFVSSFTASYFYDFDLCYTIWYVKINNIILKYLICITFVGNDDITKKRKSH